MHKIILSLICILTLLGCVRKMSVEQGNVMTPQMVSQIHTGMTQADVKHIMGNPVFLNTFNDNRIVYVYTNKPGRGVYVKKQLILTFQNNILTDIST